MEFIHVVSAIIRDERGILLVCQQSGDLSYWSLPGGVMMAGESAFDGLCREVFEETGVTIRGLKALSHVTEIKSPHRTVMACVFEVSAWEESERGEDPSGEVVAIQWVGIPEALNRLAQLPWPAMAEPITEHLTGRGSPYYVFEHSASDVQTRLPGLFDTDRTLQ